MTVALSLTQSSILCPYIRPELTKILSAPNFASAILSASKGKSKGVLGARQHQQDRRDIFRKIDGSRMIGLGEPLL
jgi:hypothetical protein